jgi:F0F1-type ATP synthase membrane subunit b/b'
LAADETDFPLVMRGYDRGLVDDAIKDFRKELINLTNLNSQLAAELREAQNRLIELETDAAEAKSPSYAGVGAKAAQILSTAEELALRLVVDAEAEREGILSTVSAEVEQQKADGQDYYEELVAEAQRRSERIINAAKSDYDETLAKATVEAERIIEEATREAGAIRGAISTEVARMRASSKREIEVKESSAARELAERRLIVERQLTQPLDETLKTALLAEQARIDLDLELTARRAEAEETYQKKYQEAVAQTQRYLDDANGQLSNALNRLAAARLEAETLEAAAKSINKATIEEARNKSEEIIVAAESEARAILSATQAKVTQRLHVMESAERKLTNERDSIMVYLNNLKQVIDQVSKEIK